MDTFENLNRYKIFLCVGNEGSISKASEKLYISQPAVSSSIKKLEESMGTTLFIRKTRGVTLTESGKVLYDSVRQAMNMLAEAENSIKDSHSAGRLRVAASSVLCKYMLMPYLTKFTEQNPDVDLSIVCTSSDRALSLLEDGRIDTALVAKPAGISHISYKPLGIIEDIFVSSPSYLNKISGENGDIFKKGKLMLLNKNNVSRMHVDNYFNENNIVPSRVLEVNDMDLLIEFAKMGVGISCVVKQFVSRELRSGTLTEITHVGSISPREAGFIYNSAIKPTNKNIQKLISLTG